MTIANWNTGSISDHVTNIIGADNIPISISGTTLTNMICQEINFAEQFTTESIGTIAIAPKYQPAIIDFTLSKLLLAIDSQEGGVTKVDLGGLNVTQGGAGGNAGLAKQLREDAIQRLKELQRKVRFKRVIACS